MSIGIWQILLVVALVVLLFGRGKISDLMGDVAKGIKSFKKGMADDGEEPHTIDHQPAEAVKADRVDTQSKVG
jgi:sec-independent protein translocase protein TatA